MSTSRSNLADDVDGGDEKDEEEDVDEEVDEEEVDEEEERDCKTMNPDAPSVGYSMLMTSRSS